MTHISDAPARLGRLRWRAGARAVIAVALLLVPVGAALAFDVLPNERATRQACERRFCEIVLSGKASGPPLKCDMVKTWDRIKIKKNSEKNTLKWGFGDARCRVSLDIPRTGIVSALKDHKHTYYFQRQTIDCQVEGGDHKINTLQVDAAPKIKFKNGRAYKVWINVKDVRGDSGLKSLVWTVSKLADGLGLFHKGTVTEINKFIHTTCQADYGNGGKKAKKPLRADAR